MTLGLDRLAPENQRRIKRHRTERIGGHPVESALVVGRGNHGYSRDEGSEHAPQVPAVEQTNIRHFQPPCVHLISNRIKRQPCLAIELHRFFQIAHSSDRQVSRDLPKPSAFLTSAPSCCPSGRSRFAEALFRCRASVANSEPSPSTC